MDQNKVQYSKAVPPFVRYCSAIIPTMFDDSLSYYEALCALWKWLQDNLVDVINHNAAATEEYTKLVLQLKEYVETYFENLDVQEEINNKLDQMAESGVLSEIIAEYATTKVDYFYITSESTSEDIINAFASGKAKVIEFEEGEYTLEDKLILTSNTKVILNGATIKASDTGVNIFGYALDSVWTSFDGIHNIEFIGGKIGTSIALMHNANIKFINIEFLDTITTHAIQIAGCKDVILEGCIFDGISIDDEHDTQRELVQIEICTHDGQPYLDDEDSVSYDKSANENITINGCIFNSGDGVNSKTYSTIGNHSYDSEVPFTVTNIKISNCVFKNAYWHQLTPCGFNNAVIENNTFTQSNTFVYEVYNIAFRYTNKHIVIRNNTFSGSNDNIISINQNSYNEEITIENNTFNTTFSNSNNLMLRNFKKVKILNNVFNDALTNNIRLIKYDGDVTYYAQDVTIDGNTFTTGNTGGSYKTCITIVKCDDIKLTNNIFTIASSSHEYGIWITGANINTYIVANNREISTFDTPRMLNGSDVNFTNIYDYDSLLEENSTSYAPKTNESLDESLTHFNKVRAILHKSGDAATMYSVVLTEYNPYTKFHSNRSYPLIFSDSSGNKITGVISFDVANNKYSYSSPDNLTLRLLFGFNS